MERAIEATDEIRAPEARIATPSGHFRPAQPPPLGPRPTETEEQLRRSMRLRPQERPEDGTGDMPRRLVPPAAQAGFEGLNAGSCCARPPDTHGAVGVNHFVEITNHRGVGVFRKSDGALVKNTTLNSFFGYTARTIFDPRIVYDRRWDRWVVFAVAFQESSTVQNVFLGVSRTSDPTGAYYLYRFDVPEPAGDFFDYPQLGMDQDALIVTANIFSGTTYVRSRAFGIPKAAAYNGRSFGRPYFDLGTPGTVAPPIVEDDNAHAFLVSASAGDPTRLRLFRATGLGRSAPAIVLQAFVPVSAFAVPPDARQPGTTDRLDTLNARFQNVSTQIGSHLLNVHTINAGNRPTAKWYQIDTATNTVPAGRSGYVLESATSDDFNPSVAGSAVGGTSANPIGRMFFTWTSTSVASGAAHHATMKGSGRLATDTANVTGGTTFARASTAYNPSSDTVERWGDYSAVSIDPVGTSTCPVGQRAWIVNERHVNATVWGSRFGRLGFC
ncbi:hypothetical protein [Streptomyces jeddahensis]|uniref:hypothetical protein n=1 Tax=Streptomyces jeddahensis TaxID=1716141 RepID=UPI00082ED0C9|nr:hypothetical protein [Streptomyces jeddahensis]